MSSISSSGSRSSSSSSSLIEITDHNFASVVLAATVPVLVDFTAAWCSPCRTIAPHVTAIAERYAGRAVVGTCDADGNSALAAQLDVRAMPTLLVFKNGAVVGQIVGAVPRARIEALLDRALAPAAATGGDVQPASSTAIGAPASVAG